MKILIHLRLNSESTTKPWKILLILIISVGLLNNSCQKPPKHFNDDAIIDSLINNWHLLASEADTAFFNFMDSDAIYIGTDATERWTKKEFKAFAIPYFEKGKAWDFKPIERKIYFSGDKNLAWFNETLNTWMGVCRSSGVLEKDNFGNWKLKHYHLSCTVPNEKVKQFIELININDTVKKE
jgi:hypothetical protein